MLTVDILNILNDCRILTFCCCRLNDVIIICSNVSECVKTVDSNAAVLII